MAPVILYCRRCEAAYASVGDLPVRCPACGQLTRWGTSPAHSQAPAPVGLPLTRDEVAFLHAIKVDPQA
jgi:hypothetical protein